MAKVNIVIYALDTTNVLQDVLLRQRRYSEAWAIIFDGLDDAVVDFACAA